MMSVNISQSLYQTLIFISISNIKKLPLWAVKLSIKSGGMFSMNENNNLNFFDYCNLAKQEYRHLIEKHPELSELSPREMEVFEKLLSDKTLSEIAEELFITYSSVHFHCKNIYKKINVSSRKQFLIKYKDL